MNEKFNKDLGMHLKRTLMHKHAHASKQTNAYIGLVCKHTTRIYISRPYIFIPHSCVPVIIMSIYIIYESSLLDVEYLNLLRL